MFHFRYHTLQLINQLSVAIWTQRSHERAVIPERFSASFESRPQLLTVDTEIAQDGASVMQFIGCGNEECRW